MLTCKDVAHRADALIDGELTGWDLLKLQMHLALCGACRRFVDQMRVTRDISRTVLALPPEDLKGTEAGRIDSLLSRLHDQKQHGGS
ncbi:MAG: anti-sigma factor [Rhodobacterales bacterium CG15_BIG_FIL_POST_REV_8_21_14_020_59_13]|nr:MAG: anti-sigma factor [Rhodobacterales bacterium CG15_BIG_FIL_POST_REV_8_21_14_020_59_13]